MISQLGWKKENQHKPINFHGSWGARASLTCQKAPVFSYPGFCISKQWKYIFRFSDTNGEHKGNYEYDLKK